MNNRPPTLKSQGFYNQTPRHSVPPNIFLEIVKCVGDYMEEI